LSPIKSLTSLSSLILVLGLIGCGFQPMYTATQDGTTLAQLDQVKVDVIADRSGQILRNFLLGTMTVDDRPCNKYLLKVNLAEISRKLAFRRDKTSRYEEITITANFTLEDLETGKTEYSDVIKEVASFSLGAQAATAAYSATVAEDSVRERALKIIADNITLRVAGHLSRKSNAESVVAPVEPGTGEDWVESGRDSDEG
jgi:LPS-assembly lipoprotein